MNFPREFTVYVTLLCTVEGPMALLYTLDEEGDVTLVGLVPC